MTRSPDATELLMGGCQLIDNFFYSNSHGVRNVWQTFTLG
jgi:hypothetical protein